MLTERYHWPDFVIDAIDPNYRTSLVAFISAQSAMERKHRPKQKRGRDTD